MKAYIDIENSHTNSVVSFELDIIQNNEKEFIFDISNLNKEQLLILKNAIDKDKTYTDIELFFVDDNNIPFWGLDYDFEMDETHLIGKYID